VVFCPLHLYCGFFSQIPFPFLGPPTAKRRGGKLRPGPFSPLSLLEGATRLQTRETIAGRRMPTSPHLAPLHMAFMGPPYCSLFGRDDCSRHDVRRRDLDVNVAVHLLGSLSLFVFVLPQCRSLNVESRCLFPKISCVFFRSAVGAVSPLLELFCPPILLPTCACTR